MSAQELREAAETLRERAKAATPGPWRVCAEGSEGSRIAPDVEDKREQTRFIGILNGRVQPEDGQNARYIATMHPGVGLALADLLAETAETWRLYGDPEFVAGEHAEFVHLARLINGGAS